MTRWNRLAQGLVLTWGMAAGCGGSNSGGSPMTPATTMDPPSYTTPAEAAAVVADIKDHMSRLAELRVVQVYDLAVAIPEASACYGGAPCSGAETNPVVAAEYARQAPRVARLTELAQSLAGSPELPTAPADVSADIAALEALAIVHFGELVTVAPASSPNCYNLPCPADVAAADAQNRRNADVVHALAARSEGL